MRRLWLLGLVFCFAGCPSDTNPLDDDPFNSDPNDPVICVGDPDTNIVCKKESEFWDCTTMPNGDVKCGREDTQTPGGTGTWECVEDGNKIVCKSKDGTAPPAGTTEWTCTTDGEWTVCEKDAPVPPGGGTWNCELDSEFNWDCTSEGTPPNPIPPPPTNPPPTTEPPEMPPGGGSYECYEADPAAGAPSLPPGEAWATVVTKKVIYNGETAVYVRVTFNKAFVDNTYGANAFAYQNAQGKSTGHSFGDLEESDKAEIFFADSKGDLAMHLAVDYISASSSASSGYACLGVKGGEGQVIMGNAADVLAARSSLHVNMNDYGYVLTQDSPATDKNYTPNPTYPKWIFDVWYEVWVRWSAFGTDGPSRAYITGIHASPSKIGPKSLTVVPGKCP